jgi:hypothetical protein
MASFPLTDRAVCSAVHDAAAAIADLLKDKTISYSVVCNSKDVCIRVRVPNGAKAPLEDKKIRFVRYFAKEAIDADLEGCRADGADAMFVFRSTFERARFARHSSARRRARREAGEWCACYLAALSVGMLLCSWAAFAAELYSNSAAMPVAASGGNSGSSGWGLRWAFVT